jgi:hypothetical protein
MTTLFSYEQVVGAINRYGRAHPPKSTDPHDPSHYVLSRALSRMAEVWGGMIFNGQLSLDIDRLDDETAGLLREWAA